MTRSYGEDMTVHHDYGLELTWSDPSGTNCFNGFSRDFEITGPRKQSALPGSAKPRFRGDPTRYSPGELLVAAVASSHMLRFLEVASQVGLVVVDYHDAVGGTAELSPRGDGEIVEVVLRPTVTVADGPYANEVKIAMLHHRAQSMSLVGKSVNLPVKVEPGELVVLNAAESEMACNTGAHKILSRTAVGA